MGKGARFGVVGTGAMGLAVAQRAIGLGMQTFTRDIDAERDRLAAEAGARVCATPAQVGERADVIQVLVVDHRQADEVIFGQDGLAAACRPDAVIVLSSTVSPGYAESVGIRLAQRPIHFIDGPVSGGPARARAGTMSMMAAGSDAAFALAMPVLEAITGALLRMGERPGDGARTKILNNLLAGVNLAAAAEAMMLGERMGLDAGRLMEAVMASSGDSWVMRDRMPRAMAGDFAPRAAVEILRKDLSLVLAAADDLGYPMPVTEAAKSVYDGTSALGFGGDDDAALVKFYRHHGRPEP